MTQTEFLTEWGKLFELELIERFHKESDLLEINKFIEHNIERFVSISNSPNGPIMRNYFETSNGILYLRVLKEIELSHEEIETVNRNVCELSMFYNYEQNEYIIILSDRDGIEVIGWVISVGKDGNPTLEFEPYDYDEV